MTAFRRSDPAPVVLALAMLAQLALVRVAFRSDGQRVLLFGIPFGTDCAFRARFGFPCPGCGLTRSITLSLYGHWGQAVSLNPAGLLAVVGLGVFAAGLLWYAIGRSAEVRKWLRTGSLWYIGIGSAVWLSWWVTRVATSL